MTSPLEIAATLLALAYVLLAIAERRWCFVAGGVSALLYGVIFWQVNLYMEAALQVFYVAVSVYGWQYWHRPQGEQPITTWTMAEHLRAALGVSAISLVAGYLLLRFTDAALPFADSFTTVAALVASWMVARKVLENWLYWVVIDTASVAIYLQRDLQLTAGLFGLYTVLAVAGFLKWRQHWRTQNQ